MVNRLQSRRVMVEETPFIAARKQSRGIVSEMKG